MSIDARVQKVLFNPDGSGRLELIDRPARGGRTAGERGQANLDFQVSYPIRRPARRLRCLGKRQRHHAG
jgi:hypothetical protein